MGLPNITDHINTEDYVMIVQDNCIRRVTYEEFISEFSLGGFSICESVMNCWGGLGDFPDGGIDDGETPTVNTPPTFSDIYISLANRTQNYLITSDKFIEKYYDAEGDEFGKVIITGGDLSGVTYKGNPLYLGMIIPADDITQFEYDAKNVDSAYRQEILIEVYDINNVKAV